MPDSSAKIDRPRIIKSANTFISLGVFLAVLLSGVGLLVSGVGWAVRWSDRNVEAAKIETLQVHRVDTLYERIRKAEKRLELLELRARKLEVALGSQQKTSNP